MESSNPLKSFLLDALKDPEIQDTLKGISLSALKEVSAKPTEPEEDLTMMAGCLQITGLARQTVYQHVNNQTIPFWKKGGRLYFSKKALRAWIKESGK